MNLPPFKWLPSDNLNCTRNSSLESTITTTIQISGLYLIAIRSFYSTSPGVSQLWINNNLYASNLPVGGKLIETYSQTKNVPLNHFTTQLRSDNGTPDTWMFVTSGRTSAVLGFNDDYFQSGGGDYQWGRASRIKTNTNVNYALISAFNLNYPTGICDVYLNCENMTVNSVFADFPNLKPDDAILSGTSSVTYNCYAWAGGMTNLVFAAGEEADVWNAPNQLATYDNFFGNTPPRYSGAWTYSRNGATSDNAVIALWGYGANNYAHASVRKPGNDNPHGYDWESKNGSKDLIKGIRFMHPKNALVSDTYGNILEYYTYTGQKAQRVAGNTPFAMTFEESISKGYSTIEKTELNDSEIHIIKKLINNTSTQNISEFENLYLLWKIACSKLPDINDVYSITRIKEYNNLTQWFKNKDSKLYILAFNKFIFKDEMCRFLVRDLTFPTYRKYFDEIINNSRNPKNWYNKQGSFLVQSPQNTCVKYVKKILNFFNVEENAILNEQLLCFPNPTDNLTQIEFTLGLTEAVTLIVTDLQGNPIHIILNSTVLKKGKHTFIWQTLDYPSGMYLVKLKSDSFNQVSKITLSK